MSIVKVITGPSLQIYDEPVAQLVKLSSRGILGEDRRQFEKRASADILSSLDSLREKIASDEALIHMLAVGATEAYGANRNGDGFRCSVCRQYHPTFVKYARFYRNHKNKDPSKSYGRVVKSAFHEPMKRIELLVALNTNDAAAQRNNGLIADREMEKLAQGRDIPVSMACRVPFDVCSYCQNKAPRTDDYCTGTHQGGMCKAGGLRDNLGALVEIDGGVHQLHADNTLPTFFDISHVYRPADRIAYVTGLLEKAAADCGRVVKSAELARQLGVSVPFELMIDNSMSPRVHHLVKVAHQLADMESAIETGNMPRAATYVTAFHPVVQAADAPFPLPLQLREKFALALRALADERVCLPLNRFVEVVTEHDTEKAAEVAEIVARELPGIYTRFTEDPDFPARLTASNYTPADCEAPPRYHSWAIKHAADLSLAPQHVHSRVIRAALHQAQPAELRTPLGCEKTATADDPVGRLAEEYALYKLAFVGALPTHDPDFQLTASLAILQNYYAG